MIGQNFTMEATVVPRVHHLTLTVVSIEESLKWYQGLFGEAILLNRDGATWKRMRAQWPSGLILGFTEHNNTARGEKFNHERVGLDHIGLGCADKEEVLAWKSKLEELGYVHGPFEEPAYGWAVTARDPSGIAVEFFAVKSA